jgi:hypothetical protein
MGRSSIDDGNSTPTSALKAGPAGCPLSPLIDRATLLVREQLERVFQHDELIVVGVLLGKLCRVLLEAEVHPVMAKLIESGLEVTAVHNHILRCTPLPFYMHVGGHGDPVKLAPALRAALAESKTPLAPPAAAASPPPAIDLDTAQLDQIIGVKGRANGGVYQFAVPPRDPVTENGMQLTPPEPRLIFMHFWANDDAVKLAKGLRAALDKTASAKS